jgi:hypothetical protein
VSLVGAATVLAATGPGLAPAGGQATTTVPGQPTMTMTGTMTPGGSVTVEAEGFLPGSTVTITMDGSSVPVASGVATALGKATIRLTIPADMAAGVHTMVLAGTSLGGQVAQLTTSMTIGAVGGPRSRRRPHRHGAGLHRLSGSPPS